MTRIFLDEPLSVGRKLSLSGDTAHYLLDVLRIRAGDRVVAVDGGGRAFDLTIEACLAGRVEAIAVAVAEAPPPAQVRLSLYQGLLKGKHFELVIQKCTELGVARIVPTITARTIARPDSERVEARVERWQRIAQEACRQCGQTQVPDIAGPVPIAAAFQQVAAAQTPGLLPYEALAGDAGSRLRDVLRSLGPVHELVAFVGPEGGFSPQEVDAARSLGLHTVSLGNLVLRAETAAIALCANVMYELG